MGIWNPRYSDGYRYFILLGRSRQNGARAAGGSWLFASNIQSRRSRYARQNRDGLCFYFGLLGALGNEQWRGVDFASGEDGPALARNGFDRCPGANSKSDPHSDFYSVGELPHLSVDQSRVYAHASTKNRDRPFSYRFVFCCYCLDPGPNRFGTEAQHKLAIACVRHFDARRSDGVNHGA